MEKRNIAIAMVCCSAVAVLIGHAADETSIDYMGQPTPGFEPQVFAKGIIFDKITKQTERFKTS